MFKKKTQKRIKQLNSALQNRENKVQLIGRSFFYFIEWFASLGQ